MLEKKIDTLVPLNRKNCLTDKAPQPKILQFGAGNFLRGFIDWMVEKLNEETPFNGGVIIVKPTERGDYTTLKEQDGLFHISTNGIKDGSLYSEHKLITCVKEVLHSYREWEQFLKTAEIPSIRFIVSNTTEAGIQFNTNDQFADAPPKEFPAKLTKWLYHRFVHFQGSPNSACVMLPCELIEDNGLALRDCILQYADQWSLGVAFKDWILDHNIFCNTLVDRIVPGFPDKRKEVLFNEIGFEDKLLVDAEPYHIFVIQSPRAIKEELPFHQTNLNVVFTEDINTFRQLKVRILNGAHTSMVPVAYLSGIESVREAVEDEVTGQYIQQLLFKEIIPSLDFPLAMSESYAKEILDRFRNPFIHHRLLDIALNTIAKFKTRVLPSLLAYYEKENTLAPRVVFALASLIWFYRGKRQKEIIPLRDDPKAIDFFQYLWSKVEDKTITVEELVLLVLKKEDFWGQDLSTINGLSEQLVIHLNAFYTKGFRVTV